MKLEKKYQLNKAIEKKGSRFILEHIKVEKDKLIATNGHILAVVPVTLDEIDKEGFILPKQIEKANKNGGYLGLHAESIVFSDGSTEPRPKDVGTFPAYENVIPKNPPKITVALNPTLLLDLAKALDSQDMVILEISEPFNAILVKTKNPEEIGVIMPINTNHKRV